MHFVGWILQQELSNLLRPVEVHYDLSIDHVTSLSCEETRGNWVDDFWTQPTKFVREKINEFRISKNRVQ